VNWPNRLTILRMALGPVAMILMMDPRPGFRIAALSTFLIAAATDLYDGYLARRYGWVTNLGRFLDPLADKLLVCLALIGLVRIGMVPVWAVWVIIGRELLITGLRSMAAYAGVLILPSRLGKWKTAAEVAAIIFYLALSVPVFVRAEGSLIEVLARASLLSAVFLAVISGFDYCWRNRLVVKRLLW